MPPFDIPSFISENARARLTKANLIELFKVNRDDFIACQGMLYEWISKEFSFILSSDPQTAFNSYCSLVTGLLFTPPTMLKKDSVDSDGYLANFFAKAICDHLTPRIPIQDWYGPNGGDEYSVVWKIQRDFIAFIAIEAFRAGVDTWGQNELSVARTRLLQLRTQARTLKAVPPPGSLPFGPPRRRP